MAPPTSLPGIYCIVHAKGYEPIGTSSLQNEAANTTVSRSCGLREPHSVEDLAKNNPSGTTVFTVLYYLCTIQLWFDPDKRKGVGESQLNYFVVDFPIHDDRTNCFSEAVDLHTRLCRD